MVRDLDLVSIHASCFQKAMQSARRRPGRGPVFQSTPPVSRRRCRIGTARMNAKQCFNPRLLFPEGDARRALDARAGAFVSIHASCFQKAMPAATQTFKCFVLFQSTPPVSRRRCHDPEMRPGGSSTCFNPRLLFPEGDAFQAAQLRFQPPEFQSTPPVSRRRLLISRNYRKHQNKQPALREPLYS